MVQDIAPELAAAFRPLPPAQKVPWDGVLARLRGSVALRRLVPMPLAVAVIRLVYTLVMARRPERLAASRAAMAAVVGGTAQEPRLEELARRHPAAMAEGFELNWRRWLLEKIPVDGGERITAARATGRGVIVCFTHYGPLNGRMSLKNYSSPGAGPAGDWFYESPPKGYYGYWFEYCRSLTRGSDYLCIPARGSFPVLAEYLKQGGLINIAIDLPGRTQTRYLGKQVEMTVGTARLAVQTDSLVVPVSLVPVRRRRWRIEVGEAMDPSDFASVEDLHQALADWHSERILLGPEHYEDPVRAGGWAVATPSGWYASAPDGAPV